MAGDERQPRERVSWIVIKNDYKWMLDPRYGRMTAYIDRRRAGRIDLGGAVSKEVTAGQSHQVRVRLWWFKSPTVTLTLGENETRTLRADIPRDRPVLANMATMMFKPWGAMHVGEGIPARPDEVRPEESREARSRGIRRSRRGYLIEGLIGALGFTLAAAGQETRTWPVAAVGYLIVAAGVLHGVAMVRRARR